MTEPAPSTLVDLVDRTAGRHPHAPAVRDAGKQLDYTQLNAAAGALAGALAEIGVGPEDRVGVYLPRGADVVVTVLGVLRAGAAYVPVDDKYPDARRDHLLGSARLRVVVTAPGWAGRVAHLGLPVLEWDGRVPETGTVLPAAAVGGAHAACVLFTSGSTGEPKGVVLEHRQMAGFALDPALPGLVPGDRTAQASGISFDTFTFEVWRTLAGGAEIVVVPSIPELISSDLRKELRRRRITAMLAPAIALNHVTRYDREAFSSLSLLCSGGDVLLPQTCSELRAGGFTGRLFNLYGPTETTVACSGQPIGPEPDYAEQVPIGHEFAGARLSILDERLREAGPGEPGELYVGGSGVGRGYLGRPGQTAARFVPDPHAGPGARMYATGDRVSRRQDGALEYLGRVDAQVKIRGVRVEPREVERVLCRHPDLREAAVVAEGGAGDRRLVAAVVPAGERVILRQVREFLAAEVPEQLVPAEFVVLEAMPLDAHGKRDLTALGELIRDRAGRRAPYVPAGTDVERFLAGLWEDLLAVEGIGRDDDFFTLGGHSLLAVRVRMALQRKLNVTVSPESLFANSVLADQALMVDEARASAVPR
jgi:amino acid adenylation domain-containing protein